MIIRKAGMQDLEQLYYMFLEFKTGQTKFIPQSFHVFRRINKTPKKIKEEILKKIRKRKGLFLVADEGGKITGFIFGEIKERKPAVFDNVIFGKFQNIFVKKEFRNRGISKLLWMKLNQWFMEKSCKYVEADVFEGNPADQIYCKWGFKLIYNVLRKRI